MAKKGAGRGVAAVLLTAALTVVLGLVCFGAVSLLAGPRAQLASVTLQQTPAPDVVTPPPAALDVAQPAKPAANAANAVSFRKSRLFVFMSFTPFVEFTYFSKMCVGSLSRSFSYCAF